MTRTKTRTTCQRSRHGDLLAIVVLVLSFLAAAQANTRTQADLAEIATTNLAVPIVVESTQNDDRLGGTVNGTFDVPFDRVRAALQRPRHWCELMTLHLNVKSCTHAPGDGDSVVNVYTGRKEFERPEDAERIVMSFKLRENSPQRLRVQLTAAAGPMGTFDYHVAAVFSPVDATTTLVRFEYRYGLGFRAQLAIGAYLATVASDKVGFTRTGRDAAGGVEYIDGMRGMVERNAVRYYLALVAFFATTGSATDEHEFDARAATAQWFDLTARFPRQLHELERAEYLSTKRREYREQERLQDALAPAPESGTQARRNDEPGFRLPASGASSNAARPSDRG